MVLRVAWEINSMSTFRRLNLVLWCVCVFVNLGFLFDNFLLGDFSWFVLLVGAMGSAV